MTSKKVSDKQRLMRDSENQVPLYVCKEDAPGIKALAKRLKISVDVLMHELIAKGLREFGEPLSADLVEYLAAHGRPIPSEPKRDPKKHGLH